MSKRGLSSEVSGKRVKGFRPGLIGAPEGLALLLVLLAALILTGCGAGGEEAAGAANADPDGASALGAGETRVWIRERGQTTVFENGRSVNADGTEVEIYVSPFPPGRTANIDFYVTRDGQSVDRTNITLQYDMTIMDHGPFQLIAVPTGRGHFLAPLDFVMDGDFWVNVSVDADGKESVINLLVRARR